MIGQAITNALGGSADLLSIINVIYLISGVLFILGLRMLGSPETARRGMFLAEIGMLMAVVGTLIDRNIVSFEWILAGAIVGIALGAIIAIWTPMTAMPQRTALSHAFGAAAVTLVGVAKFYDHPDMGAVKLTAIGFEVMFGALTFTGSLLAFLKLQGTVGGSPVTFPGQNVFNVSLFFAIIGLWVWTVIDPSQSTVFYTMLGLSLLFGILLVIPIGAADMPVVISLLNSYAGLAACATGFALDNKILIIAGALDGASGFILSVIMCKAMNRSITNVLFGAFGQGGEAAAAAGDAGAGGPIQEMKQEDAGVMFKMAETVVVVPGYGMAVAQAQHTVREFADILKTRGIKVKYAIHPVAGRMPGHMNVLLAEANVPYDELVDMEDINPEFSQTDIALVIGANDVTNPAARTTPGSPIYGMPILNVDKAKTVIVIKRSMKPGFAGIDNELYTYPNCYMFFGDAKDAISRLVSEMKTGGFH
ncbi:MAG: NAD(P)(+) transhydrogenase (Re/Si-specific) subunit beta [Leptospirales bacterium]|nr:NAD(P)(+) transhydrogenase (Re/Si-specific) subunit beta [Leptospirales bacterium]